MFLVNEKQQVNLLYRVLHEHGFYKHKHSMYRCVGSGVLQVVDPCGPESIVSAKNNTYEKTVLFGVFSLYGNIPWNPPNTGSPKGVSVTIDSHYLLGEKTLSFPGTTKSIEIMLQHGIAFFDKTCNHSQLVNVMESLDQLTIGQVVFNDSKKIAPYILSGTPDKAVRVISAIERQNWDAYRANLRSIPNYDAVRHKTKIETRLRPIQQIKDAIIKRDAISVRTALEENYRTNKAILSKLNIPLDDDCFADLGSIRF